MGSLKTILAATIFTGLLVPLAQAADLDAPQYDAPVANGQFAEFGSGWYIRGDISFARDTLPKISSDLNLIPSASTRNAWNVGAGGGYKFNNWFRSDLTLDYLRTRNTIGYGGAKACPDQYVDAADPTQPQILQNQICGVQFANNLQRRVLLANGYFDLGNWYGFTPYVGAGVGASYGTYSGGTSYLNPDGTSYNRTLTDPVTNVTTSYFYDQAVRTKKYQLAYALMAGFAVDVASHTSLDIGYRYLNLGDSRGVRAMNGTIFTKAMTEQQIRVGIRYMID